MSRVLAGDGPGEVPVVDLEGARDLAVEARRQADQALAVLREVLAVDARLVVVAVDVGVGDEPAQVPVAGEVARRGGSRWKGWASALPSLSVIDRRATYVSTPMIGLMPFVRRRLVERDRAVQGAVVGQGEAVEALRARLVDEVGDPPEPVEQAELGVRVEVDEVVRGEVVKGGQWYRRLGPAGEARHPARTAGGQASTVNGRIMSLSSCSTMWQW